MIGAQAHDLPQLLREDLDARSFQSERAIAFLRLIIPDPRLVEYMAPSHLPLSPIVQVYREILSRFRVTGRPDQSAAFLRKRCQVRRSFTALDLLVRRGWWGCNHEAWKDFCLERGRRCGRTIPSAARRRASSG
jgi:hypothetical protein